MLWLCGQAIKVLNMIKGYSKPIRVNKASQDKKSMDVGANLFIGNLDPDVDEKVRLTAAQSQTRC
jgi:splicing factor 3B subunit 4